MKVPQFRSNFYAREQFQGRTIFPFLRCSVGYVICVSHGIWPQADQDHFLPLAHGVEHGSPGQLLKVSDAPLRDAVLEMCVDSAVGHALALCFAVPNERVIREAPVVRMIVPDLNSALSGGSLERVISLHCFLACDTSLQEDEGVSGELINKYRHVFVSLLGQLAFQLRYQPWRVGLELVHGHHLSWLCRSFGGMLVISLDPPRSFCHLTVLTCRTEGLLDGEQSLGKLSRLDQLLDLVEW